MDSGRIQMSPALYEFKNALMTLDNSLTLGSLRDFQIEIQFDTDNKPVKAWIHDGKTGMTLIRIQVKA